VAFRIAPGGSERRGARKVLQLGLAFAHAGNVFCALPRSGELSIPGYQQTKNLIKPMPPELQLRFGT
jgi:hypothetical protein